MKKINADVLPLSAMTEQDVTNFKQWVWNLRSINMFDPVVMSAPRTVMCCAGNDEPLLYVPLQPVLMFDAIAAKPGLTPRQEAMCLWKIGEKVDEVAKATGYQEIWFVCRDDRVSDICAAHGFEEIKNVRVLKRTIKIGTKQCE